MLDVEKLVSGVHDYLARAVRPLADRIKAIEDREQKQEKEFRDFCKALADGFKCGS